MILRWVLVVIFLSAGFPAQAEEDYLMFLGYLEQTTLVPRDWSKGLEESCRENVNGEEICEIVVSNHCGTEKIKFNVLENIHGTIENETITLSTPIGEWCRSDVSMTWAPQFIFAIKLKKNDRDFYQSDYSIFSFETSQNDDGSWVFFTTDLYVFKLCEELTGINCEQSLRPVEPNYLINYKEYNDYGEKLFEKLREKGLLMKNDNNEVYYIMAVNVEDLKSRIKEKGDQD